MYNGQFEWLSKILYPKGRAFDAPANQIRDRLHKALAISEAQYWSDALSILDSVLPDNNNFTADDATDWERRLGIISTSGVSLSDRKLAIKRKMNHPGDIRPRQNYKYIENQLIAAGFAVKVYENKFPNGSGGYITKTPEQLIGTTTNSALHSSNIHHGAVRHGGLYSNKIVNYIEEYKDATFQIGSNYRSTFYIAGNTITTFASIPVARKDEFRQLILQLKPVQEAGFLFVHYS